VGAASGRVDALFFMVGIVGGILVFAEAYSGLARFVGSGDIGSVTLPGLLGIPFWSLAVAVAAMALGMFALIRKIERRLAEVKR
jgi:uncharacterized protein